LHEFSWKTEDLGPVLRGFGVLVAFALPSYRQGEASIAGKTRRIFHADEWKADEAFRLSRKSGGAEFLGELVWAVRCGDAIFE